MHFLIDWSHFGVPFNCYISLADTEAVDQYFVKRYFDGDKRSFIDACDKSVEATKIYLGKIATNYTHGNFVATSFFRQFTEEQFTEIEEQFIATLNEKYNDGYLRRIDQDIVARSGLYKKLYGSKSNDNPFLVGRTIRTIAQYLTLGKLIGADPQSIIVVHDTVNGSFFQQSNQYASEENTGRTVESPPIIKRNIRVY